MGGVHARQYAKMADVTLFAFDRNGSKLAEFCDRWKATPVNSFEALLDQVEALDCCLPTDLHDEFGIQALEAGKHVVMEKPMARTTSQCQALMEAAEKAGRMLMPAQVVRFFPEFAATHRAVKAGKVGEPAVIRTRRGGPAPRGSEDWFMDPSRSGGLILDLAIHDLDWIRWTFGPAKSVMTQTATRSHGQLSVPGDSALITLELESGAIAHVEATWLDPEGFRTHLEVAGSAGLISHDSRDVATVRVSGEKKTRESGVDPQEDPYYLELRAFVEAIAGRGELPVSAQDGYEAVRLCEAAIASAETGKPVRLD